MASRQASRGAARFFRRARWFDQELLAYRPYARVCGLIKCTEDGMDPERGASPPCRINTDCPTSIRRTWGSGLTTMGMDNDQQATARFARLPTQELLPGRIPAVTLLNRYTLSTCSAAVPRDLRLNSLDTKAAAARLLVKISPATGG